MLKMKIKKAIVKTHSNANGPAEHLLDMLLAAKALGDIARRFIKKTFKSDAAQAKIQKDLLYALSVMIQTEDEQLEISMFEELFKVSDEDDGQA